MVWVRDGKLYALFVDDRPEEQVANELMLANDWNNAPETEDPLIDNPDAIIV